MKKRIFSLFLTLLVISLLPIATFAGGSDYDITNKTPESDSAKNHGYITIDKTSAAKGAAVTVTVKPETGYQLKSLTAVHPIYTIADVLATVKGFPEGTGNKEPSSDAWVCGDGHFTFVCSGVLNFYSRVDNNATTMQLTAEVTAGENCYTVTSDKNTLTFNMTNGILNSIAFSSTDTIVNAMYGGTYVPTTTPEPALLPLVKQPDGTYTFTMPESDVTVTAEFIKNIPDISDATIAADSAPVYADGATIDPDTFDITVTLDSGEVIPDDAYTLCFYPDTSCTPGEEVEEIKDAGVYYVLAKGSETEGYTGTTNAVQVKVYKAALPKPVAVGGTIIYDSTEKTGVKLPDGADATKYIISGDKATEIGVYKANVALANPTNYCWSGESGNPEDTKESQPFTIDWQIDPAAKVTHDVKFMVDGTVYEEQKVGDGDFAKKPADPRKTGSKFNGWFESETASGSAFDFEKTPIMADQTLYAGWTKDDPVLYKVIQGANQTILQNADSARFRSDADYSKFLYVEVDGKRLSKDNYESYSGSTVIVLKASFIKKLAEGIHTLRIVSNDGSAKTKFTIKALPPTGDNTPAALLSLALLAALGTIAFMMKKQRKLN